MAVDVDGTTALLDDMLVSLGGEIVDCPSNVTNAEFPLLYTGCCRFEGSIEDLCQLWDAYPLEDYPDEVRLEPIDEWRVHTYSGQLMRSYYVGAEVPGVGADSPMLSSDIFLSRADGGDAILASVRLWRAVPQTD